METFLWIISSLIAPLLKLFWWGVKNLPVLRRYNLPLVNYSLKPIVDLSKFQIRFTDLETVKKWWDISDDSEVRIEEDRVYGKYLHFLPKTKDSPLDSKELPHEFAKKKKVIFFFKTMPQSKRFLNLRCYKRDDHDKRATWKNILLLANDNDPEFGSEWTIGVPPIPFGDWSYQLANVKAVFKRTLGKKNSNDSVDKDFVLKKIVRIRLKDETSIAGIYFK